MVINTSFNVRGEPIVCSPEHAYRCFLLTNMDVLVVENFLLRKQEQPNATEHEMTAPPYISVGFPMMPALPGAEQTTLRWPGFACRING